MDKNTLERFRIDPHPMVISEYHEEDAYGYYSTGAFMFGDKMILITHEPEDNGWHLSVSTKKRIPTYEEMKDIRYKFLPNRIDAAEIMPPREEFVNVHPYCRHLFEIGRK